MLVACALGGLVLLLLWACRDRRRFPLLPGSGKTVFISGCDSGIGFELVLRMHQLGMDVYAGCLRPDQQENSFPPGVRVVPLDITSQDSVRDAFEYVSSDLQHRGKTLWCLINNAGVCVCGEFDWLTWEQCSRIVDVNLTGTMRLTKAFLPLLRKTCGRIVVIGSVNGVISYPGLSVYCATKHALEGFCDALRIELEKFGCRVSLVRPGDLARITKIMANHEQEAKEMWEAMSDEHRSTYRDYFWKFHDSTLRNYGLTSPRDFSGIPLMSDVEHAVLHPRPHPRYLSAPLAPRFIYRIIAVLPDSLKDRLLQLATRRLLA